MDDHSSMPRRRRQGIYGFDSRFVVGNDEESSDTGYLPRRNQQNLEQQRLSCASPSSPEGALVSSDFGPGPTLGPAERGRVPFQEVPSATGHHIPVESEASSLSDFEPGPTLLPQDNPEEDTHEDETPVVRLIDLIPRLRQALSSGSERSSLSLPQEPTPRRSRAYTEFIGKVSDSETSSVYSVQGVSGPSAENRVSPWSCEDRPETPDLEPFPVYEDPSPEASRSNLQENQDIDRSLIPLPLKSRLKSTTSCELSEKRLSQAYVDAPVPKRALKLPPGHRPLRLTVEEQKFSREPLRTFVRQHQRIAREFARDRARERADTTVDSAYPPFSPARRFDPSRAPSAAFREPRTRTLQTRLLILLRTLLLLPVVHRNRVVLRVVPQPHKRRPYVSPTPARVARRPLGRPREVSAPVFTPSLPTDLSQRSGNKVDSNKSKRRSSDKNRLSSGLASTLRRLFRSSSKRSSEEVEEVGTSLADIDSFLSPHGSTPQQTLSPNFSQHPAAVHEDRAQRSALPDFNFPYHSPGTDIHFAAAGTPLRHPQPSVLANISALTRAIPESPTPLSRNHPAIPSPAPFWSSNMDSSRSSARISRTSRLLDPAMMAITKQKAEAMRLAKEQAAAVQEMCRRAKTDVPNYEFEELIGKGAYGRVYKGRQLPSRQLVAIKVMDIDTLDYKSIRDMKDESIKDFIHETKVMQQVKDAGAKNINMLIEAISIHSQLWLVCEYCPGGSVKTLMRATGDKLEERFIISIARELAEGLRAIHDAGIIHRDVKAANILIHEEGRLQICDFGVAGVLQSKLDKRSTWIGTPHWMPPEMFSTRGGGAHQYGSEIDVWAYGCTLYEIARGNPPNAGLREPMQIGRQLTRIAPKLEGDGFSSQLKDLVSFALNSDPMTRPTMADILEHEYIANSAEAYPTSSLSELVRIYYQWAQRGGQRISLFNPGGAMAAEFPGDNESFEDWNFSTTDGFEKRYSIIDLDELSASLAELEGEMTPMAQQPERSLFDDPPSTEMSAEEKLNFDERVKRGAAAMEGLFNEEMPTYKYETKNDFVPVEAQQRYSDLPLRTDTDRSSVMSTFIDMDLGSFDSAHYAAGSAANHPFQLADADTIRANRSSLRRNEDQSRSRLSNMESGDHQETPSYQPQTGPRPPTMEWTFPACTQPSTEDNTAEQQTTVAATDPQTEKRATMEWSFPVMTPADNSQDVVAGRQEDTLRAPVNQPLTSRLRGQGDSTDDSRPSTAQSGASITSETDYDPFRFDRGSTPPRNGPPGRHRTPISGNASDDDIGSPGDVLEQSVILDGPGPDEEENDVVHSPYWSEQYHPNLPTARPDGPSQAAGFGPSRRSEQTSLSGTTVTSNLPHITFPEIRPPSAESLTEGADESVVSTELDRLLGDFLSALSATGEALATVSTEPTRYRNASANRNGTEQ
ncbi:hypothetical protein DTO280E4_2178 [Paecilomyces variotii]|nr:hypothetical protein DTO280E4_2178 [Paecilomyces variotii]KAJ9394850.1 hypothetical protein DTO282F9_8236 [Paecilomyces variotii]